MDYISASAANLDVLVAKLKGVRVLEIFAGTGNLGQALSSRGVDVISTGLWSDSYHHGQGKLDCVEELDALSAVLKYRENVDVLLASWPIADDIMLACAASFPGDIFLVGELYHKYPGAMGYSGVASDNYFDCVKLLEPPVEMEGVGRSMLMRHRFETLSGVSQPLTRSLFPFVTIEAQKVWNDLTVHARECLLENRKNERS